MIDPKLIRDKLTEMKYRESNIIMLVNRLSNLSPQVEEQFLKWLSGEDEISLEIQDISFSELRKGHNLNPIASFLTLDWLVREPEKAISVIRRGHDMVEVNDE